MRTHRPMMSLEGTLELIDLTHASEGEALAAIRQARREGRPRRPNGRAVVIDLGTLGAPRQEPDSAAGAAEPRAPRHANGGASAGAAGGEPPFSFATFADVLRRMRPPEAAPRPEEACMSGGTEERTEMEQVFSRRTLVIEEEGAGKMVAAAVAGFGLGAAAVFLARRLRYVPPAPSHQERPRSTYPASHIASDAGWQAQLEEIERRFADGSSDDPDDDEPSLRD